MWQTAKLSAAGRISRSSSSSRSRTSRQYRYSVWGCRTWNAAAVQSSLLLLPCQPLYDQITSRGNNHNSILRGPIRTRCHPPRRHLAASTAVERLDYPKHQPQPQPQPQPPILDQQQQQQQTNGLSSSLSLRSTHKKALQSLVSALFPPVLKISPTPMPPVSVARPEAQFPLASIPSSSYIPLLIPDTTTAVWNAAAWVGLEEDATTTQENANTDEWPSSVSVVSSSSDHPPPLLAATSKDDETVVVSSFCTTDDAASSFSSWPATAAAADDDEKDIHNNNYYNNTATASETDPVHSSDVPSPTQPRVLPRPATPFFGSIGALSSSSTRNPPPRGLAQPPSMLVSQTMVAAEPTTTTTTTEVVSDAGVPLHVEGAALTSEDEDMKNVHRPIISRLVRTVNRKQHQWALDVFYEIMAHNRVHPVAARIDIPHGVVKGLFHLMEVARPFDMFQIVRYYETLETTPEYQAMGGDINGYARMYNRVCDSLRHIDPVRHSVANAQGLVRRILAVVQRFDRVGQEMCYPTIVSSMVEQKYNSLGMQFARPVYNIIVEQNMTVSKGFWHHLLSFSRYNRHCDLPYDDVLTRMVEAGQYPRPVTVLNALDNFFPFTDFDAVAKTLKVVLRMQQEVAQAAKKQNGKIDMAIADLDYLSKHQFYVDMFTLEMIGSAAASRGRSDINLLVWDMVDVLGYTPTEGIFENTVTAFAMNTFTYREAFTVLAEMTNRDFQPSRALIRSFSVQVRNSKQKLDFALEQLKQLRHEGKPFTTPALNVIMSGAAESGDIDRILSLLQEYSRNSIEADSDTFSFCFESLGKNLLRTERNPRTDDHVNACLIAADSFLTMMDEKDIVPNSHIIRNYVELLCQVDQIETATAIVLEASSDLGLVCSKTIYRAAMANAKLRQFDVARKVATCVSGENLPFLLQSIDREEDQLVTPNEIKLTEERNRLQTLQRDSERNNARPQIDSQMPSFWRAYAGNDNLDDTCLANEDRFERRRDLLDSFVE